VSPRDALLFTVPALTPMRRATVGLRQVHAVAQDDRLALPRREAPQRGGERVAVDHGLLERTARRDLGVDDAVQVAAGDVGAAELVDDERANGPPQVAQRVLDVVPAAVEPREGLAVTSSAASAGPRRAARRRAPACSAAKKRSKDLPSSTGLLSSTTTPRPLSYSWRRR
jgi:hypothetical protein